MRRGRGSRDARIPATPGDLAAFAVRAISDQQLRVVLVFSGALDAERLGEATRLLTVSWPILGCRLVLGPRPHWAPGATPAAGGVVETTDPTAALADVVAVSCDPRTGPVFDVRLLRATGGERQGITDTVCLRVDHAACDGVGAKELAYALLGLYRALGDGSGAGPSARVATAWSPRRRSYLPLLRAARPHDVARAAVLFPDHGARFRLPYHGRSRHEPRLAVVRVDAERVTRVRAYGRARGATLNDALLTAVFRALPPAESAAGAGAAQSGAAGAGPDAALRVLQMPIDLRPRQAIPAAELPPANLTGMTFPTVRVTPDEPFDDTLRRVTAATRLAKSDVAALHVPAAFSLLFLLRRHAEGPPLHRPRVARRPRRRTQHARVHQLRRPRRRAAPRGPRRRPHRRLRGLAGHLPAGPDRRSERVRRSPDPELRLLRGGRRAVRCRRDAAGGGRRTPRVDDHHACVLRGWLQESGAQDTGAHNAERPGEPFGSPGLSSGSNKSGGVLLSRRVAPEVPSALEGLTTLFGMGRGVTPPL